MYDIISFNPRRQHNFEQAFQLAKYFKSFKHVTSLYFDPSFISFTRKISTHFSQQLQKRSYPGLNKSLVDTYPYFELKRLYKRYKKSNIDYFYFNDAFCDILINKYVAPKVCIGYDNSSLKVFEAWKGKSKLVLDLCIGLPQYRLVVDKGNAFKMSDLESKDPVYKNIFERYTKEIELADIVLCGSEFVKETATFFGHSPDKFKVLNYGVEINDFDNKNKIRSTAVTGLKYVFVGSVSWRKGADLLIDVWKEFNSKHPGNTLHFYGPIDKEVNIENVKDAYFHGRVDRSVLVNELKTADVFVFPSTFEGSALSVYQAMAMMLPVITTKNSGSVIEHNEDGLISNVGSKEDLFANMQVLLTKPDLRAKFAEKAYTKVLKYTWDHYGEQLKELIDSLL